MYSSSIGPPWQDTVDSNSKLVRFAESPIMSTYLVAIIVGEFEASETKTKDNITVGGTRVNTGRDICSDGRVDFDLEVPLFCWAA